MSFIISFRSFKEGMHIAVLGLKQNFHFFMTAVLSALLVHFVRVLNYTAGTLAPKQSPAPQSTQAQSVRWVHNVLMYTFHLWEPEVYFGTIKRTSAISSSR